MAEYNLENYDFKKAMQQNIKDNFKPLLLSNSFTKSGNSKYIREKAGLVQLIVFRIEKDRVKAFASLIPLYYPLDYILSYGIEITGSNGFKLLNGKYFTTIYESEHFDKAIQLKNYYSKHQINMQKLFLSIKEGVLPEMDRIDSLDKFIKLFDQNDPVFFGYEFDNDLRKTATHKYIVAAYSCLKKDFQKSICELKQLKDQIYWKEKELIECTELLLRPEHGEQDISYERFCENYETLCDLRRKKLKLSRK